MIYVGGPSPLWGGVALGYLMKASEEGKVSKAVSTGTSTAFASVPASRSYSQFRL